jgi:lysophospholipase L1-like esterase
MKKILLALLVFLASAVAEAQNARYDTIRYAKEYYQKRLAIFKSEPVLKCQIIFLGNSITEFGNWKKLLSNASVINRGIAADNTFGLLDRLEDVIVMQPKKLFIEIGVNDISQNIPVDIIAKNITAIVARVKAKSPESKIYVLSILPTNDNVKNEYPDVFGKNAQADSVNKQLKQHAQTDGFFYIDLSTVLKDKNGKLSMKYARPDGLHLNKVGYQVWVNLLRQKNYL